MANDLVGEFTRGLLACVLFGSLSPGLTGCSGDGPTTTGSSGNAGAGGLAGGSGGTAGSDADRPCRTGVPTDAPALFAKHAGRYTFTGGAKTCEFSGTSFAPAAEYAFEVAVNPDSLKVTDSQGAALFSIAWDGVADHACTGEFVDSFELVDGANHVRAGFIGDAASSVTLGTCLFILN